MTLAAAGWRWGVLVAVVAAGCVSSNSSRCDDGRVCPEGLVCATIADPAESLCVRPEQLEDCQALEPFAPCGDGSGRCYDGVCLPGGCGNGRLDRDGDLDPALANEECDDANTEPGDGCSPICLVERCGNGALDMPLGEQCDDGITGLSGDGCSSTCRVETASWMDVSPTEISAMHGTQLAYMESDGVVIAFGGLSQIGYEDGTWAWTSATRRWVRLSPRRKPPGRRATAMAYDSIHHYILLFGGEGQLGDLADTWRWDGTTWTELHPMTVPPARRATQLAYDPARDRFVLAGGLTGTTVLRDTWEFDGTDWMQRSATGAPLFSSFAMAYHAATQQLIAAGAASTISAMETWTWNGTTWTQLSPSTIPTVEDGVRLAYDEGRQRTVLFGGIDPLSDAVWEWNGTDWEGPATPGTVPAARFQYGAAYDGTQVVIFGGAADTDGPYYNDTWTWTGSWQQGTLGVVEPSHRTRMAMAWDPLDGLAIMHGGFDGATLADSWIFDGHAWRSFGSASQPRRNAAMAFDSRRRRMVLFGGADSGNVPMTRLWEIDPASPTEWVAIDAAGPNAREGAAMAFDATRGTTVLFGGNNGLTRYGDTWTWDGTSWSAHAVPGPSPRTDARMTWDARRQRVVLFGGSAGNTSLSDTWLWDGGAWSELTTATVPRPRASHALAYDLVRGVVVMHGGTGSAFMLGDLWELDGTDWKSRVLADTRIVTAEAMMYSTTLRGIITFGGTSNGTRQGDVRLLQLGADDSVEGCIEGDDTDGDGLSGCADLDCWGACSPLCPPATTCASTDPHCGDGTCAPVEDYLVCPDDCPDL